MNVRMTSRVTFDPRFARGFDTPRSGLRNGTRHSAAIICCASPTVSTTATGSGAVFTSGRRAMTIAAVSHRLARGCEHDAMDAEAVAALWNLAPHPEGGFYRETYRSELTTTPPGWPGP